MSRSGNVKASILFLVPSILSNALPLLALPFLTRALPPEDFGLIALAQVFGTVAFGLANLGLSSAFERNWFKYREDKLALGSLYVSVIVYLIISGLGILVLAHFASPWIDEWLFHQRSPRGLVILAAAAAMLRGINQIGYGFLRNSERPKVFAVVSIFEGIAGFALTILFVIGLRTGASGFFMAQTIAYAASAAVIFRQIVKRTPGTFSRPILSEALVLGRPLTFRVLLGLLNNQFDKYMLSLLTSLGQVGLYGIGQRIAQVPYIFTTSLDAVFIPRVYRLMFQAREEASAEPLRAKEIERDKADEIGSYLIPFHYVSTGMALLVCLFAEEMLFFLTDKDFHGAADLITILSAYYATLFFSKVNGRQIVFAQRTYVSSVLLAISVALNIAFYMLLIPRGGAKGAALATLLSGVISGYISFAFAQKCFAIDWKIHRLVWSYTVLFVSAAALFALKNWDASYLVRLGAKLFSIFIYAWIGVSLGILIPTKFSAGFMYLRRHITGTKAKT